ncbi:Acrosomal protein KIAA1210 [Manis javanica]|nr:Acrosomal protein KIAA1210 [Manis javanica]
MSDPDMSESLSQVSGSLEVLESSDEGSPSDQIIDLSFWIGARQMPTKEGDNTVHFDEEQRPKSSMGNRVLSSDSFFMVEPQPERSASKIHSSLKPQRGRPLQRSHLSRTWSAAETSRAPGAMTRYVPGSGIWIAGSKFSGVTEWYCSKSHHGAHAHLASAHLVSDLIQSPRILKNSQLVIKSRKSPQKKASPHKFSTVKKVEPKQGELKKRRVQTNQKKLKIDSAASSEAPVGQDEAPKDRARGLKLSRLFLQREESLK